jgi:hypothetical protein
VLVLHAAAAVVVIAAVLSSCRRLQRLCAAGILLIKVPGLAIGGGVDARNTTPGYICLMRTKDENMTKAKEEDNVREFRETVLILFIIACRVACGWKEGDPVADFPITSWMDGAIPQLKATLTAESMQADVPSACC